MKGDVLMANLLAIVRKPSLGMQSVTLNWCKVLLQGLLPGSNLTYRRKQQPGKQDTDQITDSLQDLNMLMEISRGIQDTARGHGTCPTAWVSLCASGRTAAESERLGLERCSGSWDYENKYINK